MALIWPRILTPISESWRLVHTSLSGGVSITGQEQIVAQGFSRWQATQNFSLIRDEQILVLRGFLASLQGRTNSFLASPLECRRLNWPVDEFGRVISPAFYRRKCLDGTPFQDSTNLTENLIDIVVAANMPVRATSGTLTINKGSLLKVGQYFSIHDRLYILTSVSGSGRNVAHVTFQPNLRIAAAKGTKVRFIKPLSNMRLSSDDTATLELQMSRFGTLTLDMIEVF